MIAVKSPRYCRKVYWTKVVQNGPSDHFGQNGFTLNWIVAFARPKWTGPFWPNEVYFGPFRSANNTLATPENRSKIARFEIAEGSVCQIAAESPLNLLKSSIEITTEIAAI